MSDQREGGREERPDMVIPAHRLPPGFAERVADPPAEAAPLRPAATAVLLRESDNGPELLLLKRLRSAGFVPGAWVFPGGRVDDADGAPELTALLGPTPRGPGPAYWLATIREVFEETGLLLAHGADDSELRDAGIDADVGRWREALLSGDATLLDALRGLGLRPDISRVVYCSHWITPVAEPKRYDTRFFLAAVQPDAEARIDPREMSDAAWLTPRRALDRFQHGDLPMVFPTVKTIELLSAYDSVAAMLDAFRDADVPPMMPRLVRTSEGVGIILPDTG